MVRLVVKNAGQTDFPIELPDSATVGDLKAELQKSYPSRPTPAQQKLIFAGRLLNDGSQVISQLITTIKVPPPRWSTNTRLLVQERERDGDPLYQQDICVLRSMT
jgi:hypothetical protein